jgi:hypothetical protein
MGGHPACRVIAPSIFTEVDVRNLGCLQGPAHADRFEVRSLKYHAACGRYECTVETALQQDSQLFRGLPIASQIDQFLKAQCDFSVPRFNLAPWVGAKTWQYRSSLNGGDKDVAPKLRLIAWQYWFSGVALHHLQYQLH